MHRRLIRDNDDYFYDGLGIDRALAEDIRKAVYNQRGGRAHKL